MTKEEESIQPSETGSSGSQDQETTSPVQGEIIPRQQQLARISGAVDQDIAGLAELRPQLLGSHAAGIITASYIGEQKATIQRLQERLEAAEARSSVLAKESANVNSNNSALVQALNDERAAKTPRDAVIALGSVLFAIGVDQFIAQQFFLGGAVGVIGAATVVAAFCWRTKGPDLK